MPFPPILRNVFKMGILRQGKSRSLDSLSRHTWEAVCAVPDHGQVVRNRLRLHPELGHYTGLIAQDVAPAVQLNDSCAHDTLTEILVGCANEHLLHTIILCSLSGPRKRAHHPPQSGPWAIPSLPLPPALPQERETERATPRAYLRWSCIRDTDRFETTPRHDRLPLRCGLLRLRSSTKRKPGRHAPRQLPGRLHLSQRARRKSTETTHTSRQSSAHPCGSDQLCACDVKGSGKRFGETIVISASLSCFGLRRCQPPRSAFRRY